MKYCSGFVSLSPSMQSSVIKDSCKTLVFHGIKPMSSGL